MILGKQGILKANTPSASGFVLDGISNVAAAYSLRKLRSAHTGYAAKVRRSSDDTLLDIGFDGSGDFDSAAFSSFVGGGTGYVDTWYDQSGNARNATQATTGYQPVISLSSFSSLPSIRFDVQYMTLPDVFTGYTAGTLISSVVVDENGPADNANQRNQWRFGSNNDNQWHPLNASTCVNTFASSTAKAFNPGIDLTSPHTLSISSASGAWSAWINGVHRYTTGTNTVAWRTTPEFGQNVRDMNTNMAEVIVLGVAVSTTDHNTIGNDAATYYGLSWTTVT